MDIYYAGKTQTRLDSIELDIDGKWEQEIGFAPLHAGDSQKVEFLIYNDGEAEPENSLHIWINVGEQ